MQNEPGVTQLFNEILAEQAKADGFKFKPLPLGGQDRHALADLLFARLDYFCLAEMKFSDNELKSEAKKLKRVGKLCRALKNNPEMKALHEKCHITAYIEKATGRLVVSPYADQICNQHVLGVAFGPPAWPVMSNQIGADKFASNFFGQPPSSCASKDDFKRYLQWLLLTVTDGKVGSLRLLARGKNSANESVAIPIQSVEELNNLMRIDPSPPTPPSDPLSSTNKRRFTK